MKIKKLKNREKGKRCFILANGPSVLNFDLSKLKDEVVIGMNASTLLEKKGFSQTYYVVSDTRFLDIPYKKECATTKLNKDTICIFRKEIGNTHIFDRDICYVNALERDGFCFNLNSGFYYGCTTVMLALQLAYYLGCSEIYLLGVDLVYSEETPRFYKEEIIQIEDARVSVQVFNIVNAYRKLKDKGVALYQCNPNSLIRNYVPYKGFSSIFKNNSSSLNNNL